VQQGDYCPQAFVVVVGAILALSAGAVQAQTDRVHEAVGRGQYQIEVRQVDRPPAIDGELGVEEWRNAVVIDSFTQQEPSNGSPATERTEVRVLYVRSGCTSPYMPSIRVPRA